MGTRNRSWLRRALRSYAVYVAVGVVVGVIAAPFLAAGLSDGSAPSRPASDGTVAVITLAGTIDGETAERVTTALERARDDDSVEAVVLVVNSGGGSAAASERLYFGVRRTAAEMPVIASVDAAAASGAYYAAAPADRIVVKPASTVGSIGVLAQLPQQVEPNDIVGASGPNKLSGSDTREFLYVLESLQRAFLSAVFSHRSDEIQLSRAQVEQARVYSGGQAVENGLADEIGDRTTAVRRAAAAAELDRYRVRQLRPGNGTTRFLSRAAYLASTSDDRHVVDDDYLLGNDTGGPTFLMVSGLYLDGTDRTVSARAARQSATGDDAGATRGNTTASPAGGATPTNESTAPGTPPSPTTPTPAAALAGGEWS
ncbi:S49 family peptidase [Halobaculum sp. MBLA0147]|uniref:S49 family peptidase n=1 Tax=Halobaculum sp. MBLA0147 TaxID=3079934 RepID=UPI0035254759